jgi:hypothetical protein
MDKVPGQPPDMREARDKARFAQFSRSIIRAVAVAFGLLVGYLQIRDIRPDAFLTGSTGEQHSSSTIGHASAVSTSI